ncbi:plasmid pRiA4b ORF-3 family protein [Halomonas sp. TRM85114]|uniref:plasmid pRiA4b ORF-3 family protein n=1 Tax=Halomonas jincaotanensis TaxID=2810616 RepID=UPI001BD44185|nr:plasmid pRiA4b ORF-3 family protein [Halomonas jincaotanensis]MBS9405530.1 plasmid pRiA4b ORF-3 family protein [Halomonas jincaotanensis]
MPDIRLRIELLDTDPLVWRRVLVPEQINLHRLHEVIQAAMGWEDCHLFEFECNGRYYGEPDDWSDRPISLARNAKLKTIASRLTDNTFHYRYDFGDDWVHRITAEATGLTETNPCPRLIDGAMACPPEDIGGIAGFEALKDAAAGRGDENGEMLLDAVDGHFDPETLDEEEIDFMLEPIQAGFRRGGREAAERRMPPGIAAKRDREASLHEENLRTIEQLRQALQAESDRNRKG